MRTIELKRGWHNVNENGDDYVSLPFESPCYGKVVLSLIPEVGGAHVYADIDGADGVIDVLADGECAGTVMGGVRKLCYLGSMTAGRSSLSLEMEDGGAIRRGVTLHYTQSDVYIKPYGIFVRTDSADGEKATLTVSADMTGGESVKRRLILDLEILNDRGKRTCRKTKAFIYSGGEKSTSVQVKMRRAYAYETDKPYLYTMKASLKTENGDVLDESSTVFGVRMQGAFEPGGLIGTTVPHSNGILGEISVRDAERRKLSALRDLGYNAVRYIGCPSAAALDAADELGLKVIVDIFDNWTYPREGSLSHLTFTHDCEERAALAVSILRNHPSVVMYSVGNKPEENLGRKGSECRERIFAAVRAADPSRPVACAFGKPVPTERELAERGIKRSDTRGKSEAELIALADECGFYSSASENMLALTDICLCADGYVPPEGMPNIRIDTMPENAYESMTSAEYDQMMLGDFSVSGMDRIVHGATVAGDIDHTCLPRNSGLYRSMLAGAGGSFILVGGEGSGMLEGRRYWKASDGEKVSVRVFTPGDVVALYLDDYLVGRRLAGRVNKQFASFDVEYRPGKLEAVCYLRGRECDRVSLTTPDAPASITLLTGSKRISAGAGELGYIDVWVTDGNGEPVTDYDGDIRLSCEGEGEIVAMGNEYGKSADDDMVTAIGGHALVAVRGIKAGKLTLKAQAEDLRAGRVQITVKD